MAKNKKLLGNAIIICVLGVVLMFLYSGLQSDQINIIQTFITPDNGGWTSTATQLPMTVGNFVCIILTFVYGTFFLKFGVKKPLMIVMIVTAVRVLLIVAANGLDCNGGSACGNYALYCVGMFITRCGCMAIQLIPYSFAALMMITLISAGKANLAFGILIVIIIVGIEATLSMIKMKDANEEDRSYGKKKA